MTILLLILVAGLVLGFVGALLYLRFQHRTVARQVEQVEQVEQDEPDEPVEPDEQDDLMMARAIDPENPPHYMVYRPRSGESTLRCTCHQDPIGIEEKVLLWPIPGHPDEAIDIFCAKTYGQVSQ